MHFENLLDELKGTTGKLEKEEIVNDYFMDTDGEFIKFLLKESFDPNILHHVVLKKKGMPDPGDHLLDDRRNEVRELFDYLHTEVSPVKNRDKVWEVMSGLTEDSQLALMGVVNKKLRCGVSIKTLNKVETDFIDVTPIPLAKSYHPSENHKYSMRLYSSYKLDGQRVFCLRDTIKWKKHSRAGEYLGNEITTLDHWDEELEKYHELTGMNFLDGEAYRHGMSFDEITSLIRSSVNKKDASALQYHIFFSGRTNNLKESSRKNEMLGIPPQTLYETFKRYDYLVGVKQKLVKNNDEDIFAKVDEAVAKGFEGIVLRSTEVWIDFKRSYNLLKAKKSELGGTEELSDVCVEDIIYGDFTVREHGVETIEYLPVALLVSPCDSCDFRMKVGSGFSLQQRREWKHDESLVVGKVIEIEHQGRGSKGRFRFPRFKRVRSDL